MISSITHGPQGFPHQFTQGPPLGISSITHGPLGFPHQFNQGPPAGISSISHGPPGFPHQFNQGPQISKIGKLVIKPYSLLTLLMLLSLRKIFFKRIILLVERRGCLSRIAHQLWKMTDPHFLELCFHLCFSSIFEALYSTWPEN